MENITFKVDYNLDWNDVQAINDNFFLILLP